MVMLVGDFAQFGDVKNLCVFVKVEHRLVLAVLAVIGDVFAEIHILHVIRNHTAVTALDALAELV